MLLRLFLEDGLKSPITAFGNESVCGGPFRLCVDVCVASRLGRGFQWSVVFVIVVIVVVAVVVFIIVVASILTLQTIAAIKSARGWIRTLHWKHSTPRL